jgi:hypothetical protein
MPFVRISVLTLKSGTIYMYSHIPCICLGVHAERWSHAMSDTNMTQKNKENAKKKGKGGVIQSRTQILASQCPSTCTIEGLCIEDF